MTNRIVWAGIAVAAVTAVAGCGSSSKGSTTSVPTGVVTPTSTSHHHQSASSAPTPTRPATESPSPIVTATVTTTATETTEPAVSRCLSSTLTLSLGISQGTAGSTYQALVFTNTGAAACELHGYPGVSFVNAAGDQVGVPAKEDPGQRVTRVLAADGGQANALLRAPNPGNFSPAACQAATASRLRVYPPGETVPLYVHDRARVCTTSAGATGIGPVLSGNGG